MRCADLSRRVLGICLKRRFGNTKPGRGDTTLPERVIENASAGAEPSPAGHARHEYEAVEEACLCDPKEVHGEEKPGTAVD